MIKFLKKTRFVKKTEKEPKTNPDTPSGQQTSCISGDFPAVSMVDTAPRDSHQILKGSKKRFHEKLEYNLSLLAERIPNPRLICENFTIGSLAPKKVAAVYLKDRAHPGITAEIRKRLTAIRAETVLDSSYIERNIENSSWSPFPQVETAEKPDIAESALLQGRVVIITDGSPQVLLAPVTFFDLMDTRDDTYMRWFVAANFFRLARYIMFIFAVSLPAFYVALTSYNPELIPTRLLYLILASRENAPFPVYFEAFFLMGIVEAVRMMMVRMPSQVGTTIALMSGVTLVIAGLWSGIMGAPVVIIVTLTMISSFGIPSYDLRLAVRVLQFFTMIMASFFGIFGFAAAFFYIAIHLVTLKSFGVPYMTPLAPTDTGSMGHTVFRENTPVMSKDKTYKPQKQ